MSILSYHICKLWRVYPQSSQNFKLYNFWILRGVLLKYFTYIGLTAILVMLYTSFRNVYSYFPRSIRTKFDFDWPNSFQKCLKIMAIYIWIVSGKGQTPGVKGFQRTKSSITLFICWRFVQLKDSQCFHIKN